MDWFTQIDDSEIEVIEFSVSTPMQIDTRELQFDVLEHQFLSQLPRHIEELDAEALLRGRRLQG